MWGSWVVLCLAGCGRVAFDAPATGDAPNGNGIDAMATTDTAVVGADAVGALMFSAPADGAQVDASATIAGTCTAGIAIALSGDLTTPSSTPCVAGTFSVLVGFTAGAGTKTVSLAQDADVVQRSFTRTVPAVVHVAGAIGTTGSQGFGVNCTLAIPAPAGVVDGDLLIGTIYTDGGGGAAVAMPGWTILDTAGSVRVVFYKIASGEPVVFSFPIVAGTGPSDTCESGGAITAFRGVSVSSPIQTQSWATPSAVSSIVAPSVTVTDPAMLVALFGSNGPATGITPPGAMMADPGAASTGDWGNAVIAYQPIGAGATGTRTATIGQSRDASAALVIVQP